jgi:hypothetical protein
VLSVFPTVFAPEAVFFFRDTLRPGSHFFDEETAPENCFFEYLIEIVDFSVCGSGEPEGEGDPDGDALPDGEPDPVGDGSSHPTGGGPPGTQDCSVLMWGCAVVAPTFRAHSATNHMETTVRRIALDVRRFMEPPRGRTETGLMSLIPFAEPV